MKQIKYTKKLIVVAVLLLAVVALVACKKTDKTPYGSINQNDVYVSVDNHSVTVRELYDNLRLQSTTALSNMVDAILFENELSKVKADLANKDEYLVEELAKLVNTAIYGTTDVEAIEEMDADRKLMSIKSFVDSIYLLNNTVDKNALQSAIQNLDSAEDYTSIPELVSQYEIKLAQRVYAKTQLEKDVNDSEADQYIEDADLVTYYKNNKQNKHDVNVFVFHFLSTQEGEAALRHKDVNIKSNNFGQWFIIPELRDQTSFDENIQLAHVKKTLEDLKLPTDKPLSELEYTKYYNAYTIVTEKTDLREADQPLDSANVLNKFIAAYNLVNNKQIELVDGKIVYTNGDEFKTEFTYEELGAINSSIRTYIYNQMSTFENEDAESSKKPYSRLRSAGSASYLIFKFSEDKQEVLNEDNDGFVEGFSEEDKLALRNEYKDTLLTSTYITNKVNKLHEEAKLDIYDAVIRAYYESSYTYNGTQKSKAGNVVATLNGKDILVDDLYVALEKTYGINLSLDILVQKMLLANDKYTVSAADMKSFKEQLNTIISNFSQDAYAQSGFPASLGRAKFLLLAFGSTSFEDAIEKGFVVPKLRELYLADIESHFDDIYTKLETLSNAQYNEFKSITVNHLLVFLDANGDGTPEDPKEYYGENTVLQEATEAKLVELVEQVYGLLGSTQYPINATSINTIVTEFNNSGRIPLNTETSKDTWTELRKAGFTLKYETLSSALTNSSNFLTNQSGIMDKVFYERAIEIHDTLVAVDKDERGNFFLDFHHSNYVQSPDYP